MLLSKKSPSQKGYDFVVKVKKVNILKPQKLPESQTNKQTNKKLVLRKHWQMLSNLFPEAACGCDSGQPPALTGITASFPCYSHSQPSGLSETKNSGLRAAPPTLSPPVTTHNILPDPPSVTSFLEEVFSSSPHVIQPTAASLGSLS